MRHILAKFMYLITWPFWYTLAKFFLHLKIEYKDTSIKHCKKNPVLIIGNHVTWMDPFILPLGLPINSKLFPIRYITANGFFKIPIIGQILWFYGCIKIKRKIALNISLKWNYVINYVVEKIRLLKRGV